MKFQMPLTACCVLLGLLAVIPQTSSEASNAPRSQAAGGSQAVAYQINAAHTGSQSDTIAPPLVQRWSRDLGRHVSYPLIAEGKVFVTTGYEFASGSKLYALDAATGATSWGPIDISGTRPWSGIAYDAGRVFAVNYDGVLRAFDAASGSLLWQTRLVPETEIWAFSTPPTALNGLVYTAGSRFGGRVFGVSQLDGSIRWTATVVVGDASSPAVSADGVYVSYTCSQAYDFAPATGNLLWHHDSSCWGGGGKTPVLYGGRLYSRDSSHLGNVILNVNTGEEITGFEAYQAPAFSGSTGYFTLTNSRLQARDVASGSIKWSFNGDNTLNSAPIVVNGYVYIASNSGKLFALDAGTGANVWTGNLGSPFRFHSEGFDVSAPVPGLTAGHGMILVPASTLLVAYESVPAPMQLLGEASGPAIDQVAAMDSVLFLRDSFPVVNGANQINPASDRNTRVIIFVTNLQLAQGETSATVVVNLIGSNSQVYDVAAEDVRPVPGFDFAQVVFRLPDNLAVGTYTIRVKAHGQVSNAGTLRIRI